MWHLRRSVVRAVPATAERVHGGDRVAEVLVRHGVRTVFTLVGGHISPILTAARARGIDIVDVRDEATAAFAADAVSRLTGTPGVAAVTAGPGLTNTLTAVENARLAQSPLVLLVGATATVLRDRGSLQDIDQRAVARPHVKWIGSVARVRDLAPTVSRAFLEAASGVPGPVMVECPLDLLYPEAFVREWYLASAGKGTSLGQRALRVYLARHLSKIFAAGADDAPERARPSPMPAPGAAVRKAAAAIAHAERPVLLVGSQAVTGLQAPGPLAAAIARLGLPTYLSGMARGLLGAEHPRQLRHHRKQALREADLVILAGTPCDFRLDYGRHINRTACLIAVNRSSRDLRRNRRPTIGVLAAPDAFLGALAESASPAPDWSTWHATLCERERARDSEIAEQADAPVSPLNPLAVCAAVERHLPTNALLVADGGDFVATASYIVRPRAPLSWLDPGVFGTLGVGAGFVLGAHAADPARPIWAIFGDGALGFSLSEFDTLVKRRVPLVAIVGNDGKWAQIARDQVEVLGDDVATALGRAAYHRVVEGFGARGLLVDNPARLDAALVEANAVAGTGTPVLVNVHIGDTAFRKGSISV